MRELVAGWIGEAVVPGLVGVLALALTGMVREWVARLRDERLRALLTTLVEAAEQLYGPGKGEAKRRFVRERLRQKGLQQVSREELEAAVYRLKAD